MKKFTLFISFTVLCFGLIAQNVQYKNKTRAPKNHEISDLEKNNGLTKFVSEGEALQTRSSAEEVTPYKVFDNESVIVAKNVDNNISSFYSIKYDTYKNASNSSIINSVTINFLDDELNKVGEPKVITMPDDTRNFILSPSHNSSYYIAYVYYFVGSDRIEEGWLIDPDGSVIKKFDSVYMPDLFDGKLFTYTRRYEDEMEVNDLIVYNAVSFEKEFTLALPKPKANQGLESPLVSLKTINGKSHFIVSHFESIFYDDYEMMFLPENNYVVLDLYDVDTYSKKEIKFSLEQIIDISKLGPIPFGEIYVGIDNFLIDKWNISTNLYNDDELIEFVVSVSYKSLQPEVHPTIYYYVFNENGEIIKRFEKENLLTRSDDGDVFISSNSVEGFNDEFALAESYYVPAPTVENPYNEEHMMNLKIIDILTWEIKASIPANIDGMQLFSFLYRQKVGDALNYLIPSVTITEGDGGQREGNVLKFAQDGTQIGTMKFKLLENANFFMPNISDYTMKPGVFDDSDDISIPYSMSLENLTTGFAIAKENQDPYFTWKNSDTYGSLVGGGLMINPNTNEVKYLQFAHSSTAEGSKLVLIDLPLNTEGNSIENPSSEETLNVYFDAVSKTIKANNDNVKELVVYSINGSFVSAVNESSVSTSNWMTGLYIVKTTDMQGSVSFQKIFVY